MAGRAGGHVGVGMTGVGGAAARPGAQPSGVESGFDAELDELSLSLLPDGKRSITLDRMDLRSPYAAEELVNAVSDHIHSIAIVPTPVTTPITPPPAQPGDVQIHLLNETDDRLAAINVETSYLITAGGWPGEGNQRIAQALAAMIATYCGIDASDIATALDDIAAGRSTCVVVRPRGEGGD